ncbi:MAG: tRNA uridine-5-carboxymethylaminomethyl(34) synthesis GTPase MnmE [Pseudomonadota bacterium]
MDTIYALASARGKAGVAVIRVSGPLAQQACVQLTGKSLDSPKPSLRRLRDNSGALLDEALVLFFEKGHSFTGEDVVELQTHGSPAIVNSVMAELGQIDGVRLAEPGEFTRRALENGRMDLAQVEGLADLIEAETEAQRRQALRVFDGAIGQRVDAWRTDLIRAAALLEATIDFADEDIPIDVTPEVKELTTRVLAELSRELAGAHAAERVRDGFEVAILGEPNVGKSTLLNALAGREAAITSSVAGTTRDVIEVRMDLSGLPVTFLDTAGLRATQDEVEAIGIERALARAERADLRIILTEGGVLPPGVEQVAGDLVVAGKADLDTSGQISGTTGQGISELVSEVTSRLESKASGASLAIRARHAEALKTGATSLQNALDELDRGMERSELAAEELRIGIRALESLVGRIDVETLLDEIFASFCLGK